MLELPPDEAMVELAIALSLQDQEGGDGNHHHQLAQGLQGRALTFMNFSL